MLIALALAACAQPAPAATAAPTPIAITAAPVPLNPQDRAQNRIGDFHFAGGLVLSAADTARFHGLSDMAVTDGLKLTAISDEGDRLTATLVLDAAGRLVGLKDGKVAALPDLDGKPLQGKLEADAEGLALLPDGDMLVSFEQRHRIWLYPAAGGAPRSAPTPEAEFPANGGLEALGAAGPDSYLAGGEESGQTWICRVSGACVPGPVIAKPPEFGLVAVASLPQGRTAWLLRAWDKERGNRVSLVIHDASGEIARLDLARPLSIDNFEALAAVPGQDGAVRFYLLSDDNFQSSQRTLLLAFDWKPGGSSP